MVVALRAGVLELELACLSWMHDGGLSGWVQSSAPSGTGSGGLVAPSVEGNTGSSERLLLGRLSSSRYHPEQRALPTGEGVEFGR